APRWSIAPRVCSPSSRTPWTRVARDLSRATGSRKPSIDRQVEADRQRGAGPVVGRVVGQTDVGGDVEEHAGPEHDRSAERRRRAHEIGTVDAPAIDLGGVDEALIEREAQRRAGTGGENRPDREAELVARLD